MRKLIFLLIVLIILLYAACSATTTTSYKPDEYDTILYCYIVETPNSWHDKDYNLIGHKYISEIQIGMFQSKADAINFAHTIGCKI